MIFHHEYKSFSGDVIEPGTAVRIINKNTFADTDYAFLHTADMRLFVVPKQEFERCTTKTDYLNATREIVGEGI